MSATIFTVIVDDTEPVLTWLGAHAEGHVRRMLAERLSVSHWSLKITLDDADLSDSFRLRWAEVLAMPDI